MKVSKRRRKVKKKIEENENTRIEKKRRRKVKNKIEENENNLKKKRRFGRKNV